MKPGDIVRVYSKKVFNDVKSVSIFGEINKSGFYSYKNKMTLKDLILEAEGAKKDHFRFRAEISRVDPEVLDEDIFSESVIFELDRNYNIIEKDKIRMDVEDSFVLMPYDRVYLRPNPFFSQQKSVTISGAIYYPGEYNILKSNEKVSDIILRAGGLRNFSKLSGAEFFRNGEKIHIDFEKILKKPKSSNNLVIHEGDRINIPYEKNFITIIGEVNVPGNYAYKKSMRVKDAIRNAGGFSINANTKDVFVIFADGSSKKYSPFYRNYKLKDGAKITIGKKPDEEPFDVTEYLTELTTIMASMAQTLSLIIILMRGS